LKEEGGNPSSSDFSSTRRKRGRKKGKGPQIDLARALGEGKRLCVEFGGFQSEREKKVRNKRLFAVDLWGGGKTGSKGGRGFVLFLRVLRFVEGEGGEGQGTIMFGFRLSKSRISEKKRGGYSVGLEGKIGRKAIAAHTSWRWRGDGLAEKEREARKFFICRLIGGRKRPDDRKRGGVQTIEGKKGREEGVYIPLSLL